MTKRKLQVRKKKEPSEKVRGGRRAKTGHQPYANGSPNPKNAPFVLRTSCSPLHMSPPGAPLSCLEVTFRH